MRIHLDKSVRRIHIFYEEQYIELFTEEGPISKSLIWRSLRLSKNVLESIRSNFRRHRIAQETGAVHCSVLSVPREGCILVILELPEESVRSTVEEDG